MTVIEPPVTDYDRIILRKQTPEDEAKQYTITAVTRAGDRLRRDLRTTKQGLIGLEPTGKDVTRGNLPNAMAGTIQHLGYTVQEPAHHLADGATADNAGAGQGS